MVFILPWMLGGCGLFWDSEPEFRTDLKMKIAIAPFEDIARLTGRDFDDATALRVAKRLDEYDKFVVVPWTRIQDYLKEKHVPVPLTQNTAMLVGRAFGLNAIVLGSLSEMSLDKKQTGLLNFMPINIPYLNEESDVVTAVLVTKVVDVETGAILGADIGKGVTKTEHSKEDMISREGTDSVGKDMLARSMDQAVQKVVDNVTAALVRTPWKGYISKVDGENGVITSGNDVGIIPGMGFVVHAAGERIVNAAGQTYVVPGPVIARLEALTVAEETTEVRVLSGEIHMGETIHALE